MELYSLANIMTSITIKVYRKQTLKFVKILQTNTASKTQVATRMTIVR